MAAAGVAGKEEDLEWRGRVDCVDCECGVIGSCGGVLVHVHVHVHVHCEIEINLLSCFKFKIYILSFDLRQRKKCRCSARTTRSINFR